MLGPLIFLFAIVIIILILFRSKIDKYYDDLEYKKEKQKQEQEEKEFDREIEKKLDELKVIKEHISKNIMAKYRNELIGEMNPYLNTLDIKYNQLVYKDDYGEAVFKDWIKERNNFINRKLDSTLEKIISDCKKELDILFDFNSYPRYGLRNEAHSYFETHIFSQICELI